MASDKKEKKRFMNRMFFYKLFYYHDYSNGIISSTLKLLKLGPHEYPTKKYGKSSVN